MGSDDAESLADAREATPYSHAAVYHSASRQRAFDTELPEVPIHVFTRERDRALRGDTQTARIPLDLSNALQTGCPATLPALLASYAVVRQREMLVCDSPAGSTIYYVIEGEGETRKGAHRLKWRAGDVFCLSGAGQAEHVGGAPRSLLFVCSDEPAFRHAGATPIPQELADPPVHFHAETILRDLGDVYSRAPGAATWPVQFTTAKHKRTHSLTPTMTAGMNPLEPGGAQRQHRHSAAALTLCVQGRGYTRIGDSKIEWSPWAVMVTPPNLPHSHHNTGSDYMLNFTVQDAGLHFYLRTMNFTQLGAA